MFIIVTTSVSTVNGTAVACWFGQLPAFVTLLLKLVYFFLDALTRLEGKGLSGLTNIIIKHLNHRSNKELVIHTHFIDLCGHVLFKVMPGCDLEGFSI